MLHVEGRRWFERVNGNTYHSVRIFEDGKQIVYIPFQYGYGEQWLQTALDWLRENSRIPNVCQRCNLTAIEHAPQDKSGHWFMPHYGTLYLREQLGASYSCIDVQRKKDL